MDQAHPLYQKNKTKQNKKPRVCEGYNDEQDHTLP